MRSHRSWFGAVALVLTLGVSGAACASNASTRAAAPVAPAGGATPAVETKIVPGTTLRIGDQLEYLQTVLRLAGQDRGFPYHVSYAAFIGGPAMLQAFQAGAIDSGFVSSTPLIFAEAAHQPIRAIAGWATQQGGYDLVTAPGRRGINGFADLKGKRVAYQHGTAGEAALLQALDAVGLHLSDVQSVDVPQTQVAATLQGGGADAGLSIEPLTSVYRAANPTAAVVGRASAPPDRSFFVIATDGALRNAGKTAVIADYVQRLARSFAYLQAHPQLLIDAVYVQQYHLSAARAREILAATGTTSFLTLPGDIVAVQQHLADLFHAAGEIPNAIDVRSEFDARFAGLIRAAVHS